MNTEKIKDVINQSPQLKDKLFAYGFLLTNGQVDEREYPFFGEWDIREVNGFTLLVHGKQRSFLCKKDDVCILLVGHAYNPFTTQHDEDQILNGLISVWTEDKNKFYDGLNELSGSFSIIILEKEKVVVFGDPTCIQTNYYGVIEDKFYLSSHSRLIGDILKLEVDEYVDRLTKYKYFPLFGNLLPGDLSPFKEIKRLVPNHYLGFEGKKLQTNRFFTIDKLDKTNDEIANEVGEILHNSLDLISKKWSDPAISLTGGCDSKTTLSSANGLYDRFKYFSYVSTDEEKVDALAARKICENLGIDHKIYEISSSDENFTLLDQTKEILFWNGGGTLYNNENDIRKRRFFSGVNDFDVEIKSWCSEIGRAYYSKRFNDRKKFGKKPTSRKCTTLYKVFLTNRKLVRQTDKIFKEYIKKYMQIPKKNNIPWQEHFFWEFRISAWNGLTITGEHKYSFDITIPYNNRKLLCLLLSVDIKDRISDAVYKLIRQKRNDKVDEVGVSVTNVKHTKKRAKIENLYYTIHSKLPF